MWPQMLIIYENDTYAVSVSLNSFLLIETISGIFLKEFRVKKAYHLRFYCFSQIFLFLAIAVLKCN